VIDAVVFDLDGVIIDSEELWDEVREGLARERGGRWSAQAQADTNDRAQEVDVLDRAAQAVAGRQQGRFLLAEREPPTSASKPALSSARSC